MMSSDKNSGNATTSQQQPSPPATVQNQAPSQAVSAPPVGHYYNANVYNPGIPNAMMSPGMGAGYGSGMAMGAGYGYSPMVGPAIGGYGYGGVGYGGVHEYNHHNRACNAVNTVISIIFIMLFIGVFIFIMVKISQH